MPPDYIHLQQSKKYLEVMSVRGGRFIIERNGMYLTRNEFRPWKLFSFLPQLTIEYVASHECPEFVPEQGIKILCWDRIEPEHKQTQPQNREPGFVRIPGVVRPKAYPTAYLNLYGLTSETCYTNWSRMAKTHRKKWIEKYPQKN